MTQANFKKDICEVGKLMYARGLVASNDGNISVRSGGLIYTTPTMVSKGFMNESDIVVTDIDGKVLEGYMKPSSELKMHLEVYKSRDDIMSVVHAHPPYASAYAIVGKGIDFAYMPEAVVTLGVIPLAKYATPSTDEVANSIKPLINGYNGALLQNHGAIMWSKDLLSAYYLMEQLEFYCKTVSIAKSIGEPIAISDSDIEKLKKLRG